MNRLEEGDAIKEHEAGWKFMIYIDPVWLCILHRSITHILIGPDWRSEQCRLPPAVLCDLRLTTSKPFWDEGHHFFRSQNNNFIFAYWTDWFSRRHLHGHHFTWVWTHIFERIFTILFQSQIPILEPEEVSRMQHLKTKTLYSRILHKASRLVLVWQRISINAIHFFCDIPRLGRRKKALFRKASSLTACRVSNAMRQPGVDSSIVLR